MNELKDGVSGESQERKPCIACRELIQRDASLCPHCQSPQFPTRWKTIGTILKWVGGTTAIVSLVISMSQINSLYQNWRERQETVDELVQAARMQADAGDYAGSWKLFEQALVLEPGSRVARSGQVRLAMEWLRDIRTTGQQTFTEIVAKLLPVLYRGAATATGAQAGDLLAHIGWANYLKYRDGMRGVEVEGQFRHALKVDRDNLYAHAMWGHWILWQRGSLDEANSHFSAALKSGRDNGYVRLLKLSALRNTSERGYHPEILRLLNEMRQNHDRIKPELRDRIVNDIYYVHTGKEIDQLLASIPAKDNLETLRWLTQEIEIDQKVFLRIILARLTEATGDFHGALSLYQSLKSDPDFERFSLKEEVNKGVERISGAPR